LSKKKLVDLRHTVNALVECLKFPHFLLKPKFLNCQQIVEKKGVLSGCRKIEVTGFHASV